MTRLYFFDLKGAVRQRDRSGRRFAHPDDAIRCGELEASRLISRNPRLLASDCYVAVIDENGCEIHRAPLYRLAQPHAA